MVPALVSLCRNPLYVVMATVAMATSIIPLPKAGELHAHLWHVVASIADWVTSGQRGNLLHVRDLIKNLRPSKLLLAASTWPRLHILEVPTTRMFRAAWKIFAAWSMGWTHFIEEGCEEEFSAEVNYYL